MSYLARGLIGILLAEIALWWGFYLYPTVQDTWANFPFWLNAYVLFAAGCGLTFHAAIESSTNGGGD